MSTESPPSDLRERMQQAIANAMAGVRDKAAMERAMAEMDRIREEIAKRHGVLDVAVDLIRDARK